MEISIPAELSWFTASVIMGVLIGATGCVLSLLYTALGLGRWVAAAIDLLYFGLCGVASFLFMVVFLDGSVRIYPWGGMLLGGVPLVLLTGELRRRAELRLRLKRRKCTFFSLHWRKIIGLDKKTKKTAE